jgi:hypothetical protein
MGPPILKRNEGIQFDTFKTKQQSLQEPLHGPFFTHFKWSVCIHEAPAASGTSLEEAKTAAIEPGTLLLLHIKKTKKLGAYSHMYNKCCMM